MKKVLLGVLAVVTVFSLTACGEKKETNKPTSAITPNTNVTTNTQTSTTSQNVTETENETESEEMGEELPEEIVEENVEEVAESGEEQVGVGNTDEGMVVLVLEQYLKDGSNGEIEEVNPTNIKVYTPEEIEADETIKSHDIKEGDIVFSAEYELKIADSVSEDDLMKYTAGTGEIDGHWIRNKANVGIARAGETGYTVDNFGTGF